MTKVELVKDPRKYFDYLTSDEINVLDARFVSDEMVELHYEYNENFVEPDAKTNVVIAAFTTAYARLKLYGVLDQLQERGITLNCSAQQKVNFDVIRSLVYLHAKCNVTGKVTVDIPLKITRNAKDKNIETKRMKKDYRIVYDKRLIIDDYKTLPYGY
jgi:hypothetical protein